MPAPDLPNAPAKQTALGVPRQEALLGSELPRRWAMSLAVGAQAQLSGARCRSRLICEVQDDHMLGALIGQHSGRRIDEA